MRSTPKFLVTIAFYIDKHSSVFVESGCAYASKRQTPRILQQPALFNEQEARIAAQAGPNFTGPFRWLETPNADQSSLRYSTQTHIYLASLFSRHRPCLYPGDFCDMCPTVTVARRTARSWDKRGQQHGEMGCIPPHGRHVLRASKGCKELGTYLCCSSLGPLLTAASSRPPTLITLEDAEIRVIRRKTICKVRLLTFETDGKD